MFSLIFYLRFFYLLLSVNEGSEDTSLGQNDVFFNRFFLLFEF